MKIGMRTVVLDLFPAVGSRHFEEYATAVACCWIRPDLIDAKMKVLADDMRLEGWEIGRTLSTSTVSAETYELGSDALSRYEQALIDGFVVQFHCVQREVIAAAEHEIGGCAMSAADAHGMVAREIGPSGLLSLVSAEEWAIGVSPNGDDFLPVWIHEEAIRPWMHGWSDYRVEDPSREVGVLEFLHGVWAEELLIGLEAGPNLLMTTHPLSLAHLVALRSRKA